ncbi:MULTISPECIES: 3-hydroxyacyl-CoA dehydrogenase NAD-binding domain-containing protein [Bradyrhizobium]|uniref:Bll7821 protein n=1 Tax=Bradyrhizobium diazoefficiens (strain JCM 10833 / BCRC 13528 / IAM 13628 / NBRC 14792 / USDA 110) TaxID=224911 RepID=Q89CH6_BRADU|nr:3-hydroxyacyl-CoA dehydrogenase NAD-binding domain-containing protein [Bradyrhizobium diazoefficiens]MBP1061768.1 3-hydroxyacyl-CoA dehydrogenase [Bradyrhizobium japonicum]AND92713.1 3-hydroxyacyl-CoA dehydrogenase [Bradyrhizobium diazoefficiens USDA 110]AWO94611.1 3-hydroxyacyl-CoA dehydrogenase [Bradyrhizobium diazoefficiens]PDT59043.1 3-hydroxyacyl-CoA dehydrogenase [Bradyrhizobium diazoefficiens]QBP26556.1 3-hydroxyacyl-CoA dehydrogenase [Bradyrhizobium diazoefficiens]
MSEVVKLERHDEVGIVTVNSPPVNALSAAVRGGILECIKAAVADPAIKGIVLTCAGRTFIAGADITEFGKPPKAPALNDVLSEIENSPKPVVAAIHGTALGGGLEVALACHFRVAVKEAKLGLPEVKLGLLPGAGGTQRLPRAVGPELAVKMIVGGDPIGAAEALKNGLIEEIVEGPASGGEAFVRKLLAEKRPLRRLRDDDSKLAAAKADRSIFTNAVAAMTKKSRGLEAPFAAADAVGYAIDFPFDEGLKKEREGFLKLVASDQSKAQRYAFFAEREAAKIAGVPEGTKSRPVNRVAILGAGTMGGGIAMSFANAGVPVTLIETGEEQLKRGLGIMQKNWEATAARGGIPADAPAKRMALITGVVGIENVGDADLVIEAVFETMAVKKEVFGKLDQFAKPGAVLASNTSYLNIDEIAKSTKRPQDVLGMHFFSPANVMKLCEIVRADKTAPDALVTAVTIARKIAKVPAVVGVCDGFVGNRMLAQRGKQSEKLLFEGALPQQVDAVVTKFGMPMGPFAMGDLAGLDIGWRSRKDRGIKSEIADALCEAGRFGQKTGKGYYKYEAGSRSALPDPEVEKLIDETLARLGRKKRAVSDEEILERMMYPMINEGAKILEEGIAARPSDIDVVWLYGYGWPIYRGGPMFWADTVGLKHIADRLSFYAKETNDPSLEPAPLLKKLAAEGKTFASLAAASKAA